MNPAVDPISGQRTQAHADCDRRVNVAWHGTILLGGGHAARFRVILGAIRGAGYHAHLLAGDQPLGAASGAIRALRATNPVPGSRGRTAPRLLSPTAGWRPSCRSVRSTTGRSGIGWRRSWHSIGWMTGSEAALLQGRGVTDRGGEICACFWRLAGCCRSDDRRWRDELRRHRCSHPPAPLRFLSSGDPLTSRSAAAKGGVRCVAFLVPHPVRPMRARCRRHRGGGAQDRLARGRAR